MNYILILVAVLAGYHAYTFALVLKKQGNYLGTVGVAVVVSISLALPIFHLFQSP